MSVLREFRQFISKGNVLDMAVGIVTGVAFGNIVKSFVDDILMPPLGLLMGGVDFSNQFVLLKQGTTPGPYASAKAAEQAGAVAMRYGMLLNHIVSFLLVSFAVFLLVKVASRLRHKADDHPSQKKCPFCISSISVDATRCAFCTSELPKGNAASG